MFTGLIETRGRLARALPRGPDTTLVIEASADLVRALTLGESVAVDGACLTVTRWGGTTFEVDASSETLRRTTLGERRAGDALHLERALKLGDRLGGHIVAGHVDATGTIARIEPLGAARQVTISAPPEVARYLVPKGSIAIDGVSLTVNGVYEDAFDVVLIPHTQSVVHLHSKPVGARVNLEADLIGKYVERLLAPRLGHTPAGATEGHSGGISLDMLAKHGFVRGVGG